MSRGGAWPGSFLEALASRFLGAYQCQVALLLKKKQLHSATRSLAPLVALQLVRMRRAGRRCPDAAGRAAAARLTYTSSGRRQ